MYKTVHIFRPNNSSILNKNKTTTIKANLKKSYYQTYNNICSVSTLKKDNIKNS